jgi:L-seryl-tRNA(Ser) seleniumtransferase
VGKKAYIDQMKSSQLLRALRVDKITLAALEGTLLEYLEGIPQKNIPVLDMLTRTDQELAQQGQNLQRKLKKALGQMEQVEAIKTVPVDDMVGGGAYPTYTLPGVGIEIKLAPSMLEQVTASLRQQHPAILVRKQENSMQISLRTLLKGDGDKLVTGLQKALQQVKADA